LANPANSAHRKLAPLLEELIVTGACWDVVDNIAFNMIGRRLAHYPAERTL